MCDQAAPEVSALRAIGPPTRKLIKGKLLESPVLRQQAQSNSKEQFAASPDLPNANQEAIMAALDAHGVMSKQALNSPAIQKAMLDVLLNYGQLWEDLRAVVR